MKIEYMDNDDLTAAYMDHIDRVDMMGDDKQGRLIFREIFHRWQGAISDREEWSDAYRQSRNIAVSQTVYKNAAIEQLKKAITLLEK